MNYSTPFSYRYGSDQMRKVFSEEYKYRLWRNIWVALAQAQYKTGIISKKELADLQKHQSDIDIERIYEIERETKHDVVAAIREFAEKCSIGGGKIHLGATSMDIVDNADSIKINEALALIATKLKKLLMAFSVQISKYADLACMGYTHLQPAEPTTVGYRLSFYAQDLLTDFEYLQFVKNTIKAKGFKGAVGTKASYDALVNHQKSLLNLIEKSACEQLHVMPADITSQVSTRKYDYLILSLLAGIAASSAKFAGDLRILQSPLYGEWSEPFGRDQVGSSAMPFKRNPITAENICSLARYVVHLPTVTIENAMHSNLERTLDDSANRRIVIPESFLAVDQILLSSYGLITQMVVNKRRIMHNLIQFAPFSATEEILIAAVKNGGNRQKIHEHLRTIALKSWNQIQKNGNNPMREILLQDQLLSRYISNKQLKMCLNVSSHIGDAPRRARTLVKKIQKLALE